MYLIKYAPAYYHALRFDADKNDIICVGVLFYNTSTRERDFYKIKNYERFTIINDDVNIKRCLDGEENAIRKYEEYNGSPFDIKAFVRMHKYEHIMFYDIKELEVEESFDYKTYIAKLYLRYDFPKSERL